MQAVRFFGPGDLRPQSVPTPELTRDGTVSVRVVAAGVCGSDLHNFTTGRWVAGLPVTPGHELAGIVTATRGACLGLRVGQPVVADSRVGCGQCEACEAGLPNRCRSLGFVGEVCDGGFAQTVVLPARQLVALPTDLPLHLAALAEPLSVALHAIGQLR
ncbi:alcohol dehydrogenase catalytic domain-containing protein, partial [Ameyamaea chiangmaiensis]